MHPTEVFRTICCTIASGKVWRGEFCNPAKGGRLYWGDTTIIPRRDARDKVAAYTSIRIDITERKQVETALQDSETLNPSSLMALSEGIIVQDRRGRRVSCNPAARKILDISALTIGLGRRRSILVVGTISARMVASSGI